jgi:hypothetical protein
MEHQRLFVSFWHIELDNLPVGVIEHRRLVPEEARALIGEARQSNRLLCLSADDLLAPYKKRELASYKELCAVLGQHFGIPLAPRLNYWPFVKPCAHSACRRTASPPGGQPPAADIPADVHWRGEYGG